MIKWKTKKIDEGCLWVERRMDILKLLKQFPTEIDGIAIKDYIEQSEINNHSLEFSSNFAVALNIKQIIFRYCIKVLAIIKGLQMQLVHL